VSPTLSYITGLLLTVLVSMQGLATQHPSAVPHYPSTRHLMQFPKADLIVLLEHLEHPDENAARLLASDDPADIGLGIFVASLSGDVDRLLEARDLLFDERDTIPQGDFPDAYNSTNVHRRAQTIGQYLNRMYRVWFGFDNMSTEQIHAAVTEIAAHGTAWEHAHAWQCLYKVSLSEEMRSTVLEELRNIPDDMHALQYLRLTRGWAQRAETSSTGEVMVQILALSDEALRLFIARGISGSGGDTSRRDVRSILESLSPETRQAIQTRSLEFPPDPVFQETHHPYSGAGIYGWYEAVTRPAP